MGNNSTSSLQINSRNRWFGASILITLLACGLFGYWTVIRTDRQMRSDLLRQSQLLAQAVDISRIKSLSGNVSDVNNSEYQRLKAELAAVRTIYPRCNSISLIGRRPDGNLFFYLDSEAGGAGKDVSPGSAYSGTSEDFMRCFDTGAAGIERTCGNGKDRSISGCVPIFDSQASRPGFATMAEAREMVADAVEFSRESGRERFLKECNNPNGRFCKGDLYVFVYDAKINMLANPKRPELVGLNLLNAKDWTGGRYFRREILTKALTENRGWVSYEYENPITKRLEPKTSYFERVGDIIICAGAYHSTGSTIAILCVDILEKEWNKALIRAQFPLMFFALVLIAALLTGFFLSLRLSRSESFLMRHIDPVLTFINVMLLVFFITWLTYDRESNVRYRSFLQLGDSRTSVVAERLRDIQIAEQECYLHFYDSQECIAIEKFRSFAEHLVENSLIQSCKWVQVVSAADKSRVEEQMRLEGVNGFNIWQMGQNEKHIQVSGREFYYPILQSVAVVGERYSIGYDLGSEPQALAAIKDSLQSGLVASSDPFVLPYSIGPQKNIMIYYPMSSRIGPKHILGFILVELQMDNLLKCVEQDKVARMQLSLLQPDASPKIIATTQDADSPSEMSISTMRPVLAFGKAFALFVYAGPEFMHLYPMYGVWLALFLGILFAMIIASFVLMTVRRQEALEKLVAKRTVELLKNEKYLSDTLHSISDAVIACDVNGNIESMNAVAESLTGWKAEEARRRSVSDVFKTINPETREEIEVPVFASIRENLILRQSGNAVLVARHRAEYRIASSCSPIHCESGGIIGAVLVFRNVTEDYNRRKLLRESESRLNQLLNQNKTIVWEVDTDGLFTYLNHAVEPVLGFSPEELVGKKYFYDLYYEADRERLKRIGMAFLKHKKPFKGLEHFVLAKDGRAVWISTNGIPLLNEDGSIRGYRGSKTDITERKQKEIYQAANRQALQILSGPESLQVSMERIVSEIKARSGADAVGIRMKESNGFPYLVKDGFNDEFLSSKEVFDVRRNDDKTRHKYSCSLVLDGKKVSSVTHGGSYWNNDCYSGSDDRSADSFPVFCQECSGHGYASIALVPICVKDRISGILQLASRRKGFFSYSAIEQLEDMADHVGEAFLRKNAEQELKESESKYRMLFDKMSEGFILHDIVYDESGEPVDFRVIEVNSAFEEMTGFKREAITGKKMSEFLKKIEHDWIDVYLKVLQEGAPRTFEKYSKQVDKHFLVTAYSAEKGQWAVLFLDTTERRQMLVKLEKRLNREKVFSSILARLMKETDFDEMIKYSLGEICKIFPMANCSIAIFGNEMEIFYHWSTDGIGMRTVMSLSKSQLSDMFSHEDPLILPYSGDEHVNVESFLLIPIDLGNGKHGILEFDKPQNAKWDDDDVEWLNTVSDLIKTICELNESKTEVEFQQLQLMQADKMISLGILVAGVAHEINNPNNAIMLNIDIIQKIVDKALPLLDEKAEAIGDFNIAGLPYSELKEEIPTLFTGVVESAGRIKKIVAGLKDYARENSSELKEKIKITEVIDSSLLLLSHMTKRAVEKINVHYQENLPLITGNFQQIEQVFINLIQNACESAPGRKIKLDITVEYDRNANKVCSVVHDNGNGISEKDLKRLTDPFFTTKRNSGGTGLGLSISAGIVRSHGGDLVFESQEGAGSSVKVILPVNIINPDTEGGVSE